MNRQLSRGFSLLEILVVLILLGILVTIVGGTVVRNLDSVKIRRAGNELVAALRYTRGQAIVKREETFLTVNLETRTYQAANRPTVELPEQLDVVLRTATSDILDNSSGRIRFFPDGSSTGGRITLAAGSREQRIDVAWLTGEVSLEQDDG